MAVVCAACFIALAGCAGVVTRHPDYPFYCEDADADVDCVRVYYGTNRAVATGTAPGMYGEIAEEVLNADGGALVLGEAEVWLPRLGPDGCELGETPMARGQAPSDPLEQAEYVFVTQISVMGRREFVSSLGVELNAVSRGGTRSALLFVHGFNVEFEPALIRSAQLATDLAHDSGFWPGPPILFSWPSQGRMSLSAYRDDREIAREAPPHLIEFLDILTRDVELDRINIIAHSMGNRVLVAALEDYAQAYLAREDARPVDFRIILAAADVETRVFDLASEAIVRLKPNVTIYTSDDDLALNVISLLESEPRLGQTNGDRPYVRPAAGFETVDATRVASELFGDGHGYYSNNPYILNDIRCVLAEIPPEARSLDEARYAGDPDGEIYYLTEPDGRPDEESCALRRRVYPVEPRDLGDREPLRYAPPPPPPPPMAPPPEPYYCEKVVASVYFDERASELTPRARQVLDFAMQDALQCGFGELVVAGHADDTASSVENEAISRRRAEAVRDYFGALGVPDEMIRIEAYGDARPLVPRREGASDPLNRRVEFVFRPSRS
jgi:esterase/lipase superfamily enzyme/outer membrane protein OmpA-like peptidoglycan-associated protein